jgi:hypothetical protein
MFIENEKAAFYGQRLQLYSEEDFEQAGFPPGTAGRFQQIMEHEEAFVTAYSMLLGDLSLQPCNYTL